MTHANLDLISRREFSCLVSLLTRRLYAMFSEGYASLTAPFGLRRERCAEALRLALALSNHPDTRSGAAQALVALAPFRPPDSTTGSTTTEVFGRSAIRIALHGMAR
jgi:predicted RNA polymerase sigma factor